MFGRNKNRPRGAAAGQPRIVQHDQYLVPTRPTKAIVAAVITLAGVVGIHLTHGTAELVVGLVQLVLVSYGVWRARNKPQAQPGPGVQGYMP